MPPDGQRYKLAFRTPDSHLETIKASIFATGAGSWGGYSEVCFTTAGRGQFRPGSGAKYTGTSGALETVDEVSCQIYVFGEDAVKEAVAALKRSHPYEAPGYEVIKLENF